MNWAFLQNWTFWWTPTYSSLSIFVRWPLSSYSLFYHLEAFATFCSSKLFFWCHPHLFPLLLASIPLSPSASLNVCTYTYTYTHTHTHTKNYPMYTVLLLPLFKTICMSILSPSVCINPSIISCNIFCPTLLWLGIHYIWPEPPPSPNYYQENDPQTFSIHRSMHFWPPPFLFS